MNEKITFLGTGHATVTRCYNTCFTLHTDNTVLLVDAGGGNGILVRLQQAGIAIADIHHMYVTHAHTDHILGTIWVIRMVLSTAGYEGQFHVYGHAKVLRVISMICQETLSAKHRKLMQERIVMTEVTDGMTFSAGDIKMQGFDIYSKKEPQYGFRAIMPSGKVVVCLGDEPFNERCHSYAENADWLLSEAFCLHAHSDKYHPYEKCHSTALDAGRVANSLGARHLVLYHTEDDHLSTRREEYTAEASTQYLGKIYVPDDGEVITL